MADALVKNAPLQEVKDEYPLETAALAQKFDAKKKYMFELAAQNMERELPIMNMRTNRQEPHKKFKPYQNIVFTSQIIWKGERRILRYYDGCTSIFADEQPKDEKSIEQYIRQTKRRDILEGKFGCFGDEKMLLMYLNICSWNTESPFRTRSANEVFKPVNADKIATQETERLDKIDEALKLAKEASTLKMNIHANYLEIPTIDYESGNVMTENEIRAAYRKEALKNPVEFIKSFGDKTLEIKYFINKALEQGIISNKYNSNKAAWQKSNNVICDISGIKSNEGIAARLLEHSQLPEGEEFVIQLKSLFS